MFFILFVHVCVGFNAFAFPLILFNMLFVDIQVILINKSCIRLTNIFVDNAS